MYTLYRHTPQGYGNNSNNNDNANNYKLNPMADHPGLSVEVVVAIAIGVPTLLVALLALWIGYLTMRHSGETQGRRGRDTFSMLPLMAYGMAGLAPPLMPIRPPVARLARLRGV